MRKLRAEHRSLSESFNLAHEAKLRLQEQLLRMGLALVGESKARRGRLKQEQKKIRKEAWRVEQECRTLYARLQSVKTQLQASESSFAREELFLFLKSGRYELTPLSLANAVVNLPYSGWRQSMRRCKKEPSNAGNGLTYQVFKAVRYIAVEASKRTQNALIKDFQDAIPQLPSRFNAAKAKLAEHWFYIERAIRRAYKPDTILSPLPFKITAEYLKQLRSQTMLDLALVERNRIKLSKRLVAARSGNSGSDSDRRR